MVIVFPPRLLQAQFSHVLASTIPTCFPWVAKASPPARPGPLDLASTFTLTRIGGHLTFAGSEVLMVQARVPVDENFGASNNESHLCARRPR